MNNQQLLKRLGLFIGAWLVLWVLVFWEALTSAVSVWWVSEIFNHCFLVLPIAFYFIWQQRGAVLAVQPHISWLGLLATAGALAVAVLGSAAGINVFEHIGAFSLLPIIVLTLFGWQVVAQIAYPLLLIMFAVPIGEEIVPILQQVTADIAMWMLQLVNIPVYRNALYFTIPDGVFFVAEACSGISFLIACCMLGFAYAYLNFTSRWRAVSFIVLAVLVPILANGARVFGIIYIGFKTNMEYAVGADHLIYGGVFFAFILVLLFVIGYFLSDGQRVWCNEIKQVDPVWFGYINNKTIILAMSPLLMMGLVALVLSNPVTEDTFNLSRVDGDVVVSADEAGSMVWTPRFVGADVYAINEQSSIDAGGATLQAKTYTAVYQHNEPGHELISSANRLYDIDLWSLETSYSQPVDGLGTVTVLDLSNLAGQRRLLAYWYTLPTRVSSSQLEIKLQQAFNSLVRNPQGGVVTVVNMDYQGLGDTQQAAMQQFLQAYAVPWVKQLQSAASEK